MFHHTLIILIQPCLLVISVTVLYMFQHNHHAVAVTPLWEICGYSPLRCCQMHLTGGYCMKNDFA